MDRHTRRLQANLHARQQVEAFCRHHGIDLRVNNEGHHWIFHRKGKLVEWWPSSAKLVCNKQWKQEVLRFLGSNQDSPPEQVTE
jgi:hypothetical protein